MIKNKDYISIIKKYKNKIDYKGINIDDIIKKINEQKYINNNKNYMLYTKYTYILNNLLNNTNNMNHDITNIKLIIDIMNNLMINIYDNNNLEKSNKEISEIIKKLNYLIHN